MHGYKNAKLPNHCGSCAWLEWEENWCRCENPAFVEDNDICTEIANTAGEGRAIDIPLLCRAIMEERMENADWQPYQCVCDLHVNNNLTQEEKDAAKERTYNAFEEEVREQYEKHGAELTA